MAILTISRQLGSGGREVGLGVASSLGYDYVDRTRFIHDLKEIDDIWERMGRDMDERKPSFFEKFDMSFTAFGSLVQSVLLKCALADRVVLMGRGGSHLFKDIPHAFRIRVVAPVEARLERISARESIDPHSARLLTKRTDKERAGFVYSLFGKPWDDPSEFDEVFDTASLPLEQIINSVIETLRSRDRLKTPKAENTIRMRAMAARIKAGLFANPRVLAPTLDVEYDGCGLVVTGIVRGPRHLRRVEDESRKLAGDLPVRFDVRYRVN
jgi:cytidylate kinase